MGYVFSPFVMSRLNTRPQFIAALIISAVAQVSITLITDWVILCQSRKVTINAIDYVVNCHAHQYHQGSLHLRLGWASL